MIIREKECLFCKIIEKKLPSKIVYEDDQTLGFLDIFPISKGHTIIIPKNHYSTIEDIPVHVLGDVFNSVKKIATKIHENLKIEGYNILQNNFPASGQVVNHFHVHIIPRNINDNKFRLMIPRSQATENELEEVLRAI
ncbi:MAG: HIT family protein [Promethearchaeota archaeon]|jgi:histidine triad (HIT) family protein